MQRTDAVYDTDWEFYDDFYADVDDIDFYAALAKRSGGPVLEVMCGTGRVLVPLARAGFEVTGIDSNDRMLEAARRKLEREPPEVRRRAILVKADARDFALGRKFNLVILAFSSVNHLLTPEDQDRAMACLKRHLMEDGLLAVASFNPHPERLHSEKLDKEVELGNGDLLIRYSNLAVNPENGLMRVKYRWEVESGGALARESLSEFDLRLLKPNQLKALLEGAGLQVVERYGGYRGEPQTPGGDIVVFVARPRMVWKENEKLLAP
jgi:ubiquinone/menaquinone biosynthesis C-methylase UbiE